MTIDQLVSELRMVALDDRLRGTSRAQELRQSLQKCGVEAVEGLAKLLHDPDIRVSEAAADALQMIPNEHAYDKLVEYTLHHLEDPTQRTKLPGPGWRRLRVIGEAILPAMGRAYTSEWPFDTRLSMIHIVQQINSPAGLSLLEAALTESDSRLVEAAAEALGSVDGPSAYERLCRLLGSEDVQRCVGAIRGLELLGNPAAVEPLLRVLLDEDQSYVQWGSGTAALSRATLHHAAAAAIDVLTGEHLAGDLVQIHLWISKHLGK